MNNYHYTDIFSRGLSDKIIDVAISTAKYEINKEIDIIVLKHKILLHYYEFKNIPKFDEYYHTKLQDIVVDYHVEIYKIAVGLAIENILMRSTSIKEMHILRYFQLSINDLKHKYGTRV